MEAEEKPQHRAKAKPCKAGVSGRTCSSTRRPISSRDMTVLRTGAAGSHSSLPRRSFRVHESGSVEGGNDNDAMPEKKSDLLIVAMKPVKAGAVIVNDFETPRSCI